MLAIALAAALAQAPAAPAAGADYVPGEVLVRFQGDGSHLVELPKGVGVGAATRALERNPEVAYAVPNYIATASAFPNDPGRSGKPGGWRRMQWNFLPCGSTCNPAAQSADFEARGGIDAPAAWRTLSSRGKVGAKGVRIAVLDTGIAFRSKKPRFRRSPDFSPRQFARGYDFVDKDKLPLDEDGHGTHVAGTIGEQTGNKRALTGLAYRAKILPVRVLDDEGIGTARNIARGLRYAIKRHADVINMSFEFGVGIDSCAQIPDVCKALKTATRKRGIVAVAASGNKAQSVAAMPARAPRVIGVGATTKDACVASYSSGGDGLDLVAPGGGGPRNIPPVCISDGTSFDIAAPIFQLTFNGPGFRNFAFPGNYIGTSMASAHASGVAAMVIASRVLGKNPSPDAVECQLEATARSGGPPELGEPYSSSDFGAGLIDAGAAVKARAASC